MVAWRYEISLLVFKLISHSFAALNREKLSGLNSFLFIFKSHCFLSFEFAGSLNVITFDVELFKQFGAAQNTMMSHTCELHH